MIDRLTTRTLAIVGGGPAGLMAAETAIAAGIQVDVYESKGSVGRKFLIAGKGGLNLTHSEPYGEFIARYGSQRQHIERWLSQFNADDLRTWATTLGIETFVGTSGRVFPAEMKAAPLLRAWVRRLREQGVRFHVHHYCVGIDSERRLAFQTPEGEASVQADAIVLALGGGSWPQLGSDGRWVEWLRAHHVDIAALAPSNCGFDVAWSEVFAQRFAGHPVKSVAVAVVSHGTTLRQQGEFVTTSSGVEGSLIYAFSALIRDEIRERGAMQIHLDLAPDLTHERLERQLAQPRGGRSLTEFLRRTVNIEGVKTGLLYEVVPKSAMNDAHRLAATLKSLPLTLLRPRPLDEVISTAGGVRFDAMSDDLMISLLPGVFCAGEMIDWEAPTGGYLLTACFASGRLAGQGAVEWINSFRSP